MDGTADGAAPPGTARAALWRALPFAAVLYLPFLAVETLCIAGIGWGIPAAELAFLGLAVATLAILTDLLLLAFPRRRARAIRTLLPAVVLVLLFVPVGRLAGVVHRVALRFATQRAAPLVAAIERHHRETGAPPATLDELVPRWLDRIPPRLPPLEIVTGDASRWLYGSPWCLRARVPIGAFGPGQLLYVPDGPCTGPGFGEWRERIGGWFYVSS